MRGCDQSRNFNDFPTVSFVISTLDLAELFAENCGLYFCWEGVFITVTLKLLNIYKLVVNYLF